MKKLISLIVILFISYLSYSQTNEHITLPDIKEFYLGQAKSDVKMLLDSFDLKYSETENLKDITVLKLKKYKLTCFGYKIKSLYFGFDNKDKIIAITVETRDKIDPKFMMLLRSKYEGIKNYTLIQRTDYVQNKWDMYIYKFYWVYSDKASFFRVQK